jgi:hypothetical protein
MKRSSVCCLLVLATCLMAQSPVKETFAYSRKAIAGIPGNDSLPTSYFIYVIIQRGTLISVGGVCLRGQRYGGTLQQVDSPVLSPHDVSVPTGATDTLVKRTSDDVYQIEFGEPSGPCPDGSAEAKLAQRYEVVVSLKSGHANWYGLVTKIVPLHPAAAM